MSEPSVDARAPKTERFNLRSTERQAQLLRRAAAVTDHTVTDFVLDSAVENAERILADRRWFTATDEQFDRFVELLDAPVPTPKFDKLFTRPSRFTRAD